MTMLTNEEKRIIEMTAELWNALLALPEYHPNDMPENARDIHCIQNRVLSRAARRDHGMLFVPGS